MQKQCDALIAAIRDEGFTEQAQAFFIAIPVAFIAEDASQPLCFPADSDLVLFSFELLVENGYLSKKTEPEPDIPNKMGTHSHSATEKGKLLAELCLNLIQKIPVQ